jgi:hypothetical protein
MARHLGACKARKETQARAELGKGRRTRLYHLAVVGGYDLDYWLHLEVQAEATLADLDQFLRDIWLECCGHLSMFKIDDKRYDSQLFDDWWGVDDSRDMDVRLSKVLTPELRFSHEYDFGSTTYLSLRVVAESEWKAPEDVDITIMARNLPPEYRCDTCGKPATMVNVFEDYALVCDDCDETEGEGDGLLPIVNSPRVGTCGYTGDAW